MAFQIAKWEEDLDAIRCEGNRLFKAQNWTGYSQCIDLAARKTELGSMITDTYTKSDTLSRIVMSAYSNRAEAGLRLENFEEALRDADKALEFDPKHVKSLVRKGKTAHGLGLYEKACTVFKAALIQSTAQCHVDSILANLADSTTFYEQSQHGRYNLSEYYSRGCIGDVPSFADFVGPVEIRRVSYGCGRRGLFATRGVEAGELLLVSNPMAIVRDKTDTVSELILNIQYEIMGLSKDYVTLLRNPQDLVTDLANQAMTSKRKTAQLYTLAIGGKQEMEIPSMELFRPGSEWVPANPDKLDVDVRLISKIVELNSFGTTGGTDLTDLTKQQEDHTSGLWLLPSFANHSCAPNCSITFIGGAKFIRAFRGILDGEELTVTYFNIFQTLERRQTDAKNWHFTCECERCSFEESLKPQLSKVSNYSVPALMEAANEECRQHGHQRNRATKELTKVVAEIQKVIVKLDSKEQNWIRAAYLDAYLSKYRLAMDEQDPQYRTSVLKLLVDSTTAIHINPVSMEMAAMLMFEIKHRYPKSSPTYRLTEERVLSIYKIAFGNQPNKILHDLVRRMMQL